MKVVLLKDIKKTGKAHTVVDVKDGHALNFLIPNKLAVAATPKTLKDAELRVEQEKQRKAVESKLIEERLAALSEERVVFKKKAKEKGHLYDGLDAKEIAEQVGLPEDAISIERPFKELGTFDVPVSFGESFGKFSVVIEEE